ncbi:hypothetical protein V6N11_048857 [Hibiscus sabdariffa]|uniref:Reverse transcriptase zinc-binding domain-containing protein n=1 Tax=Hibiscus sabdariffa TaxID=183260 RepID=A0ABR2PWI8_9ROSI
MSKLAWSLVCRPNDLWIRALREKYKVLSLCPLSISSNNCSPLWRGISRAWASLRENIRWLLGDGSEIHISDFFGLLNANGQWDIDRLSVVLLPVAIPHIMGILPPQTDATCDIISWSKSSSGVFTLASTYRDLVGMAWDHPDSLWSNIWSLTVPQRIRTFLWLVVRERLLTNIERSRCFMTLDSSCPSCGCFSETILHILRDCPTIQCLWQSIVPLDNHGPFFSMSLQDWVIANITMASPVGIVSAPWNLFFASFIRQTWKRRNDFLFTYSCLTLSDVYRISLAWAVHFRGQVQPPPLVSAPLSEDVSWQPPHQGWFCLNTDAAVTAITSMGSIEGVIRGSSGEWIVGYTKQIGHVSPLQAEL